MNLDGWFGRAVRARKSYECCMCGRLMGKGEKHFIWPRHELLGRPRKCVCCTYVALDDELYAILWTVNHNGWTDFLKKYG